MTSAKIPNVLSSATLKCHHHCCRRQSSTASIFDSVVLDRIMIMGYKTSGKRPFSQRWCSSEKTAMISLISIALLAGTYPPHYVTGFSTYSFSSPVARYRPQPSSWHMSRAMKVSRRERVSLQETSVPEPSVDETNGETNAISVMKTPRPRKRVYWQKVSRMPKKAVRIYADYASRLWTETNPVARKRIAEDKAAAAVRAVKHIMQGEEYVAFSEESEEARQQLLNACQVMLKTMEKSRPASTSMHDVAVVAESCTDTAAKPKKARRSILFGAMMGAIVACWVFSGNYIFTGVFTLMTILGQLEYYRMVMNTGIYPARRISVVGACSMFLTALFAPHLHEICLPMFGLWAMIWFLTMRRQVSTISEIATTFTGMFYLGYIPSFWVRIRLLGAGREPTRLAPLAAPFLNMLGRKAESLPRFIPQAVHLPITTGAVFIFWTWLCLAFSDVGAYFVGRKYGRTKLGKIAPAAGATSPNKSVEGVLGGCAASALLGIAGAWVQNWPLWALTGAVHGILLGLIGLIGDLTASMLKRNAGLKDFGDLIPEHGGILDRVDSFVFTAPYSWLVCAYIIPALKQAARAGSALPV